MGVRGTPTMHIQGNALGGVLRDLDRRARSTTRRRGGKGAEGQPGTQGGRGRDGRPGTVVAAAVVMTGEDGRAVWEYPSPYAVPPVLSAIPVDPEPDGEAAMWAVLESVDGVRAVVRVRRTRTRRGAGVAAPVGAGVAVHVTACPVGG